MRTIKSKLVMLICLISVIGIVLSTILNYRVMAKMVKEQTIYKLEQISEKHTIEIETWLTSQISLFNEVYNDIQYNGINEMDEIINFLQYKNGNNKEIEEYYLAFPNNTLITENGQWKAYEGYDVRDRDWFIEAIEDDEIQISSPYKDVHHGNIIITLSKKIVLENGETAVFCSDIRIDYIVDLINKSRPSEEGYGFLLDGDKYILAHPNIDYVYSPDSGLIKLDEVYDKVEDVKENNKMSLVLDANEVEKYMFLNKLKDTGMFIGLVIPSNELTRPIEIIYENAIKLTTLIVIVAIIAAFILGESITKPIIAANYYINKVASLDIREDLDEKYLKREDELGDMYSAFSNIIHELSIFLNRLSEMVSEINEFASQLSKLSYKGDLNFGNMNSEMINLLEITVNQGNRLESTVDEVNQIDLSGLDKDSKTLIQALLSRLQNEVNILDFNKLIIEENIRYIKKQDLDMESIESASNCLKELSRELEEYLSRFRYK